MITDRHGNKPYALIYNHGTPVAFSVEEYQHAEAVAKICRCGTCNCCAVVEYVAANKKDTDRG